MASERTPGPWSVKEARSRSGDVVYHYIDSEPGHAIAATWNPTSPAESRANATLMAAAPDLLDALERILLLSGEDVTQWRKTHMLEDARRAVKRATEGDGTC